MKNQVKNEFEIGYTINPSLHVNKALKKQVEKSMNTKFGELTQPFIKTKLLKKNKRVSIINVSRDKRRKA